MFTFNIIIENLEKRLNQLRALHIMAGLLILVYGLRGFIDLPTNNMLLYSALPAGLAIVAIAIFKKELLYNIQNNRIFRVLETAFITMGALHFLKNNYNITAFCFFTSALLVLFMLMIENQILNGYQVIINDAGVSRNIGFKIKNTTWQEIENVIVKDNILTVDLKNNYLMQSKFSNSLTDNEVNLFNEFCQKHLTNKL